MAETSPLTISVKSLRELFRMAGINYGKREVIMFLEQVPQQDFNDFSDKLDDLIITFHNKYVAKDEDSGS